MPLGVQDTWIDGVESYVLVRSPEAAAVAARFGRAVRWWPTDSAAQADEPWLLSPPHEDAWAAARRRIRAFAAREQDMECVLVQSGESRGAAWSEDGDYHTPMYEDALAAMRRSVPGGPELYESPVRIAARLSRELSTCAAALWGNDQEPGLEGICLWDSGALHWSASTYTAAEIEEVFGAYTRGDSPELTDVDRYESFYLAGPAGETRKVGQPLVEWADAELRQLGLGLDLSLSPHNMHPFDLVRHAGMGLGEFVVAMAD